MRWTPGGRSRNLEDRRGASPGGFGFGGGGGGFGGARLGVGGILVLVVLSLVFKRDLVTDVIGGGGPVAVAPQPGGANGALQDPAEENMVQFVSFVLDTTQAMWHGILPQYEDARLVLFRDVVNSACGTAQSASGPFYCPGDRRVYVDLSFFEQLDRQFGAPGDFAQAYVLAHEIGHHVQNLLGTERQLRALQQQNPGQANQLSVAMELQADCYAGVWGNTAARQGHLEAGDLNEGLAAASSVGDDRLQKMSTGRVSPESFTHGSAEQRRSWFKRGFDTGDPTQCDTFAALRGR